VLDERGDLDLDRRVVRLGHGDAVRSDRSG